MNTEPRLIVLHPHYGRIEYLPVERGSNPLMALRGGGYARRHDLIQHAMARRWQTRLEPGRGEE